MKAIELSGMIMNIQVVPCKAGIAVDKISSMDRSSLEKIIRMAYYEGHKDARHDAAELVLVEDAKSKEW